MEVNFYSFPMPEDGIEKIEKALLELERLEKEGTPLDQEVIDWMNFANNILCAHISP